MQFSAGLPSAMSSTRTADDCHEEKIRTNGSVGHLQVSKSTGTLELYGRARFLLLQSYFVRVLLTSEFFFALLFLAVLLVAGAAYLVAAVGASWLERSRQNMENGRPC